LWPWRHFANDFCDVRTGLVFLVPLITNEPPTPFKVRSCLLTFLFVVLILLPTCHEEKHELCLQIRLVTSLLCAFSGSLLTILELCTPTKGSPSRYTMESDCGNAYTTCNPFEVLDAVVKAQSNGSGSTGSPTSSGGSTSQKGYAGGGAALGTPSRGSVPSGSQLMQQERVSRRSLYIDCKQIADFSLRT
jgi:hypothetical protein